MRNYKIRFSIVGIAAVILVMIPNIMYLFMTPNSDPLSKNEAAYWLGNMLENIGRIGMIMSICIIRNKQAMRNNRILDIITICSLFFYYVLWVGYFRNTCNGVTLVGMAFFPSVFFVLVSWKLRNVFALAFSLLFAVAHNAITCSNFLF